MFGVQDTPSLSYHLLGGALACFLVDPSLLSSMNIGGESQLLSSLIDISTEARHV